MDNLYELASNLDHPESGADLRGRADRIADYFVYDKGDGKFLQFAPLTARAREGYDAASLNNTDYIQATASVPLFSARFVDEMGEALNGEVVFHPCTVVCHDKEFAFFAGRTTQVRELVDVANSSFHVLTDGNRILERARYAPVPNPDFLLAREASERSRLLASARLRDLVVARGLKVRFLAPV